MAVILSGKISGLFSGMVLIFFCHTFACSEDTPYLEFVNGEVKIKDLNREVLYTFSRYNNTQEDWQSVFPVRTKLSGDGPTIAGQYILHADGISFVPRFPFVSGVTYVATFFTDQLAKNHNEVYLPEINPEILSLEFSLPSNAGEAPLITAVYPSSSVLPENLLKFHITFSTAMTRGEVYKRVKLIDENLNEVKNAFLIVDEELWDNEMKTLTILLDPGRIKRGLKANLEMGTPMKQGEKYELVIEPGWKNVNGDFLSGTYRKSFICNGADRRSPSVEKWKVLAPSSPDDLLVLQMNESMDAILLANAIVIKDNLGNKVEGSILPLERESGIAFRPTRGWINQAYVLYINPMLEDLAGNNLNRVFDKDEMESGSGHTKTKTSITFALNSLPIDR